MLVIDNSMKQISVTRGDSVNLKFKVKLKDDYYIFKSGDIVRFKVYSKRKLEENPVLVKVLNITEETTTIEIALSSSDTKLGEIKNKPVEYWYELELNGSITLIGYTEELGAPIFMLLPEGSGE